MFGPQVQLLEGICPESRGQNENICRLYKLRIYTKEKKPENEIEIVNLSKGPPQKTLINPPGTLNNCTFYSLLNTISLINPCLAAKDPVSVFYSKGFDSISTFRSGGNCQTGRNIFLLEI